MDSFYQSVPSSSPRHIAVIHFTNPHGVTTQYTVPVITLNKGVSVWSTENKKHPGFYLHLFLLQHPSFLCVDLTFQPPSLYQWVHSTSLPQILASSIVFRFFLRVPISLLTLSIASLGAVVYPITSVLWQLKEEELVFCLLKLFFLAVRTGVTPCAQTACGSGNQVYTLYSTLFSSLSPHFPFLRTYSVLLFWLVKLNPYVFNFQDLLPHIFNFINIL